jgi:hypothetical protein
VPPRTTCAPETKLLPVMAKEKLPVPTLAGFVPVRVGTGFNRVTALEADAELEAALMALTVKVFGLGSATGAV